MFYAVKLSKDTDGSWLVDVPALPFVHTHGATREEALTRAVDAVLTGLEMLVDDKAEIPRPLQSAPAKGAAVRLSALVAAKIELHNAMLAQRVGKYRLGKKLDWHLPQVDRLIDFRHQSKLDQIEQALAALGRRLVVTSAA
jgi:antitoxin HicB